MTRRPLVSVILSTRNRAERLPGAIRSVLAQTLADLELIVVDHGSTDDTRSVVAGIADGDDRVRYEWMSERRGGAAEARNRGLDLVRGEYVSFIDDDDRWTAEKAASQVAAMRSRPALGGVSCFYDEHDESSGIAHVYRGPTGYSPRSLLWAHFSLGIFVMARLADYGDELRFDESLITCEDWDLWLRCSRVKPIDTIPRNLYRASFHRAQAQASVERRISGRRGFVAKHAATMSRRCLAYHEARLEIMGSSGVRERLALAASVAVRYPPSVTAILARESLSARVARRTGDPGRSLRTLHAMIEERP